MSKVEKVNVSSNPVKKLIGVVGDVSNTYSGDFTTIAVAGYNTNGKMKLNSFDVVVSNEIKDKLFGRINAGQCVTVEYRENKAGQVYTNKDGVDVDVKRDGIFAEAIMPINKIIFDMEVKRLENQTEE